VIIEEACSGYEGLGLVAAFLAVYLWIFRNRLRFPHALVLLPLGLASVWLLNSARLAALASLGAHISPHVAMQGFHSQAGWIGFLLVSVALMALGQSWGVLSGAARPARSATAGVDRQTVAYLVPFIALMLTSMLMAAAAPNDRPLYALKVAAVGLALWVYRDVYRRLTWRLSAEALIAGLAVGVAWIVTDPQSENGAFLGEWISQLGLPKAFAWLAMRLIGTALLVPMAEELAFRGFLYRWLIDRRFETVAYGTLSLFALVASSLLFGALHERWLAASLSGIVFALVMWRTRRMGDPIVAHAIANGLIFAWAVGSGQWSLL
jgi:exosortase E/protease (VPEID-CTERM system)